MILLDKPAASPKAVATCSPGGAVAQHYRVQYRETPDACWKLYSTCRRREQAQCCCDDLQRRGYCARLVSYRLCPVAP